MSYDGTRHICGPSCDFPLCEVEENKVKMRMNQSGGETITRPDGTETCPHPELRFSGTHWYADHSTGYEERVDYYTCSACGLRMSQFDADEVVGGRR